MVELAELQIKALDELVAGLKKKRRQVAEQIEADRAEIAAIEREQAEIHKKYDPMAERMRDRQAKRDALVAQLEACKRHMNTIMTETRDSIRKVRSSTGRLYGNDARQKLKDARGYSMGSHRSTRKGRRS